MTTLEKLRADFQNDADSLLLKLREASEQVRKIEAQREQVMCAMSRVDTYLAAERKAAK